jgi:hypothetical protein
MVLAMIQAMQSDICDLRAELAEERGTRETDMQALFCIVKGEQEARAHEMGRATDARREDYTILKDLISDKASEHTARYMEFKLELVTMRRDVESLKVQQDELGLELGDLRSLPSVCATMKKTMAFHYSSIRSSMDTAVADMIKEVVKHVAENRNIMGAQTKQVNELFGHTNELTIHLNVLTARVDRAAAFYQRLRYRVMHLYESNSHRWSEAWDGPVIRSAAIR